MSKSRQGFTLIELLIVIGIFFIYSAGHQRQEMGLRSLYLKQIVFAVIGIVVFLGQFR